MTDGTFLNAKRLNTLNCNAFGGQKKRDDDKFDKILFLAPSVPPFRAFLAPDHPGLCHAHPWMVRGWDRPLGRARSVWRDAGHDSVVIQEKNLKEEKSQITL